MSQKEPQMKVHSESRRHWKNCPLFVPMSLLSEEWAKINHDQTLARLNERGGMGVLEILNNIQKRRFAISQKETQEEVDELNRILAEHGILN